MAKDKDDESGSTAYKLLTVIAAAGGAFAARKFLRVVWKAASGKEPPTNPEHPEVTWPEAVSWAVLSGAVVGVARLFAQKKIAITWHRSTGELPPGLREKTTV